MNAVEIIPIVTLFLCMPLDATPPPYPVRADDLAFFPALHIVEEERTQALDRYQHAQWRRDYARANCRADESYWSEVARQAHFAWDCWDDLRLAYAGRDDVLGGSTEIWLRRLCRNIGRFRYAHGQLPGVVDVREPVVEVVPLP